MYEKVIGSGVICCGSSGEYASEVITSPGVDNGCAVACDTLRELVGEHASWEGVCRAVTEASFYARGGSGSAASLGRAVWDKERFLGQLELASRRNGVWIEDIMAGLEYPLSRGLESEVYKVRGDQYVVKLNSFFFLEGVGGIARFIDRFASHNATFTNVPYAILGFASDSVGKPCIVLRQPFIIAERVVLQAEIDSFLSSISFRPALISDGSEGWSNGTYELWDARPRNVLVDHQGTLHFIDVVINSIPSGASSLH